MKIFKILLCTAFIIAIAACGGKKSDPYDLPDDEPTTPGEIGDQCKKNSDCRDGLVCIARKCQEPASDKDDSDDSDTVVDDDTDTGMNDDDTDTDTNVPDDDTDTAEPTSDDDTDTDEPTPDNDTDTDEPVYIPECGNGLRDPGEECDNGLENSDEPGIIGITCRTNCRLARCGDTILDSGELCDDGNFTSGDYCSPDCNMVTGFCGDRIKQNNEACDSALDPYCSEDCSEVTGFCGDGAINGNEICDKAEPDVGNGEGIGPYYCNVSCSKVIGGCGDGILQLNEKCDNGDNNGRYGYCSSDCSGPGERCGDGIKQINEICDDGNTSNGDYCSADCQTSFGSCGDGIKQDFEVCDKSTSGDGIGTYCSDDCKQIIGSCGDGTVNGNEECDNGVGLNGRTECDYGNAMGCEVCSLNCRKTAGIPRYCGDGVVSTIAGEVCDKANFGNGIGQYCSDNCKTVIGSCGDGIVQPFEACDKALTGDGIGSSCSDDCRQIVGHCGDGTIQTNEECDNGVNNGNMTCPYGEKSCEVCTDACKTASGNTAYCGDGKRDDEYGEVCDHGINNDHYGYCKSDCSGLGEHCGDGIENGNEECDDGTDNGRTECDYGPENCSVCNTNCKSVPGTAHYCGDGVVNGNETCDDGAHNGEHGYCAADCRGEGERCGDGIPNGNEICDEGDELNGTYGHCKSDCSGMGERCGDGIINGNETCDDGANNGKYKRTAPGYCNSNCDGYGEGGYCGDDSENGSEECDYGANNGKTDCVYGATSCTVCNTNCKLRNGNTSYCGDGVISRKNGEICDDGNYNSEYGGNCNKACTGPSPKCGDSNTDSEFGETCDDGENNGQYSQSAPGYCDSDCKGTGSAGYCGDGEINGYETCDSGPLNGEYGGYCNSSCNGYTPRCGDGFTDTDHGEICDDGVNNGSYNHCNSDCSARIECGDGIKQPEEECDNGDGINGIVIDCAYGETTCKYCSDSCTEVAGNTAYCGDKVVNEPYEICDDGTDNSNYGFCNSNCNGYMPKCGDGNTDTPYGETCDDGELNGTYGHCNINCNGAVNCGDGNISDGEFCDNGPLNGTYGYCNETCTDVVGSCGDGYWQNANCGGTQGCIEMPGGTEECDKGITNNGKTACNYGEMECYVCTASCESILGTTSYCGDGNIDEGHETCDDGPENGQFGKCNKTCSGTVTWRCGDSEVDYIHGETCDDGENNGKPGYCNSTCDGRTLYCGDGKIQRSDCTGYSNCEKVEGMSEECDDRYMNGQQGFCYSDCSGKCGDGTIQTGHETCDDGSDNGTIGYCNDTCDGDTPVCGNGIKEKGELCDEGDDNGKYYGHCNDTCSSTTWSGYCGDGKLQVKTASDCDTLEMCSESLSENCCEVVVFAEGENSETCDEGENNDYHGHCNKYCNDIASCGDGDVGKDELCEANESLIEPGEDPLECSSFPQFKSGTITVCNADCMPILTDCVNADSYTSPFFESGQTKCYSNSEELIPCPASGAFHGQEHDFSYIAHDFAKDGEEIITEAVSSLVWQTITPTNYSGCLNGDSCTLEEAVEYCSNSMTGGHGGWRLPTAAEFSTIMDYASTVHIYSDFGETTHGSYWTSDGIVFSTVDGTSSASTGTAQVKCVWDESPCTAVQCSNITRLLDFNDSMITTYMAQGMKSVFWYFGSSKTWEQALSFCEGFSNSNGFNNMRLPNVNELMSIIDRKNGGSLKSGFTGRAWTSTTWENGTDVTNAYVINFSDGSVSTDTKTNNNIVICVE